DREILRPSENEDLDNIGTIVDVEPRKSVLARAVRTTGSRGAGGRERQQVLIANVDQALFVFAAAHPQPNLRMLDRFLIVAESSHIEDMKIVINKTDLVPKEIINHHFAPYAAMGYEIIQTSAKKGVGIDTLRDMLRDKVSVFTGPSGVGKTSLLNAIQPELGRAVKAVSRVHKEGMHTTRDSALVKLDVGGYLADTPGIRNLNIWDMEPEELDGYMRDIAAHVPNCRFSNCTHVNEPGCAVRRAVADGKIAKRRYKHYLVLHEELMETLELSWG
ncbi:MAG: ribosome small subunit-dependent GTPase A, partial [Chloroflexota bacterium]